MLLISLVFLYKKLEQSGSVSGWVSKPGVHGSGEFSDAVFIFGMRDKEPTNQQTKYPTGREASKEKFMLLMALLPEDKAFQTTRNFPGF